MDFSYSAEELAFRDDLRDWLAANLPAGWGDSVFEPVDEDERAHFRLEWEKKLFTGGWNGIDWPKKYGGRGASLVEQAIFAEENARARAPDGLNIIGRNLVGTTLLHHGSEAQRLRYLPKILSGEELWCQGFSEPNAGSDLAAIRCSATRCGRSFHRQRTEDLDEFCAVRAVVHSAGSYGRLRAEASGHQFPAGGYENAGNFDTAPQANLWGIGI